MVTLYHQSHASIMVRAGAVLFALGYIAFIMLELITTLEHQPGAPCYNPLKAASSFLNIVFVVLQGTLIVCYPRLNLHINGVIDRYTIVNNFSIAQRQYDSGSDSAACTSWRQT